MNMFWLLLLIPLYPLAIIIRGHLEDKRKASRRIVDIDRLELIESHHGEYGLWACTVFYANGTQEDGTIWGDTHAMDISTLEIT